MDVPGLNVSGLEYLRCQLCSNVVQLILFLRNAGLDGRSTVGHVYDRFNYFSTDFHFLAEQLLIQTGGALCRCNGRVSNGGTGY